MRQANLVNNKSQLRNYEFQAVTHIKLLHSYLNITDTHDQYDLNLQKQVYFILLITNLLLDNWRFYKLIGINK